MRPPPLPKTFLDTPIAHRGLHDKANGCPENSRAAFQAAVDAGFGIELDLQLSRDGDAMVFHDYDMLRLTGRKGPIQQQSTQDLMSCALLHGSQETIPRLLDVLELVQGKVPLLVELKDQDGAMGPNVGTLERSVAKMVEAYSGPIAFMSFNPYSVTALAELLPNHPRGLTTDLMDDSDAQLVPERRRKELAEISEFASTKSSFISHDWRVLSTPRVAELKAQGVPVLCWTVTSKSQEKQAREVADNVTFEKYIPS